MLKRLCTILGVFVGILLVTGHFFSQTPDLRKTSVIKTAKKAPFNVLKNSKPQVKVGRFPHRITQSSNYQMNQDVSYRWARIYGAKERDLIYSIDQTLDGGYIAAVRTYSFAEINPGFTVWILKLSPTGTIEWENIYTKPSYSRAYCIKSVSDGGYIFSGMRTFPGALPSKGYIVKLFPDGNIQWTYVYGGAWGDKISFIEETSDGGFICTGLIGPIIDGITKDLWGLKIRAAGSIEWEKKYGGPGKEGEWEHESERPTIRQTSDGGYILAGTTESFGQGDTDIWVLKLKPNTEGEIDWQYTYGGSNREEFWSGQKIAEAADGSGYFVGATTWTFGYQGSRDPWVLKLSPNGKVIWQKTYGSENNDTLASLQSTNDGSCVVCGTILSFTLSSLGYPQTWVFKVDGESGDLVWEYGLGENNAMSAGRCIEQTSDQGFIVGSYTLREQDTSYDFLVVKLGPNGEWVEGNNFRKNTNAVVQDTFVQAVPTQVNPLITGGTFYYEPLLKIPVATDSFLIAWNLHQPPSNVSFIRENNRSLFSGESIHTITWNPNPKNSEYNIVKYNIYRMETGINNTVFELMGVVPSSILEFKDKALDSNKFYIYSVTSVDAKGNESGRSEPVGNGL